MRKIATLSFLFCLILLMSSILTVYAQTSLDVTILTSRQSYSRGDVVNISGSLLLNDQPTTGLIGLLLVDANGNTVTTRTIQSGIVTNLQGEIATAYLSDQASNHLTSASAGGLAYFTITVVNKDTVPRDLLAIVSVYDNDGVPISSGSTMQKQVPSGGRLTTTVSVAIPSWAASGSAYAYGELFSNWPNQGGSPLAQETPIPFTLNGIIQGSNQPSTSSGNQGSYELTFRLSAKAFIGQNNIYISSTSSGLTASNILSYYVNQAGDFNGDGALDFNDLVAFANNWIEYYNDQPWNRITDINKDGTVDFNDLISFANAWILYYNGT